MKKTPGIYLYLFFPKRTENTIMTANAAIKTYRDVKRVLAPVYMPLILIGNINRAVSKAKDPLPSLSQVGTRGR